MPAWFHASGYVLARLVLERGLGVVYALAFLVTLGQFRPLAGEKGLTPAPRFLARVSFWDAPSVFHLVRYTDRRLVALAVGGLVLALVVASGLSDRLPAPVSTAIWLTLWALYLSIVNIGGRFYSFGWESLLLEAGFLAAFLGPATVAVPAPILWAFRWLLLRVELGAGLIKLRGDRCWRDLTCLYYHHETQPMPNPLSWYFHRLPKPLHRIEVLGSHVAQLAAPPLLFFPQPVAGAAAIFMAVTQSWLVLSGNFSWLNLVTILLTASAMDDAMLVHVLPVPAAQATVAPGFDVVVAAVALLVAALSYRPAKNLVSKRQLMNASFDPFRLVNTYGAFGSISKRRYEIVVEGTADDPEAKGAAWRIYEFRGKPTALTRRPRQWAPYHLRLDWLMWFAGLSPERELPWLLPLLGKLLENDRPTLRLLANDPFPDAPPRAVRVELYHYRFTTWKERRATGKWWSRRYLGEALPPITRDELAIDVREP